MARKSKTTPYKMKKRIGAAILLWLAVIFFVGLPVAVAVILYHRTPVETGQLIQGQNNPTGFSSSLDLRVAAKNTYPSAPLTITRDLGTIDGLAQKIISFRVPSDGLTEYGLMIMPAGAAPASGYPTIILCHGYENYQEYSTTRDMVTDMIFYAQRGFLVIKPDYRGQGLSINQGHPDSAYYSMAYNTDLMSLLSAIKQTKFINKSNLSLWGFSMGAYIALRAAVLSPQVKNLVLLSGPVDSLSKMYLNYIPPSDSNNLYALKTRNEVFAKYGTPAESDNFWKYASPINLVGRIKAHIQINVGALDQTVPTEFSADLDQALSKAHISHDYYVYPDGNHGLGPQRSLIWNRSLQILSPKPVILPSA